MTDNAFVAGLLLTSLTTSLLVLPLKLLTGYLGKRYTPKWKYWAWLALSLRLLIPIAAAAPRAPIQIPIPALRIERPLPAADPAAPALTGALSTQNSALSTPAPQAPAPVPAQNALTEELSTQHSKLSTPRASAAHVWLLGVVCMAVYHILGYGLGRRRLLRWSVPAGESAAGAVYAWLAQEMDIQKPPRLYISRRAAGPLLTGLVKPIIVLPHGSDSEAELRLILRHELTHSKRRDVWYKLLLLTVNVLHWYNPLVYLMRREAEEDLELVCDRETTKSQTFAEKQEYGGVILKTASEKRVHSAMSTSFPSTAKILRRRLENLLAGQKKSGVIPFCAFLLLVGVTGTLAACQPVPPAPMGELNIQNSELSTAAPPAPPLSDVMIDVEPPVTAEQSEFPRKLASLDEAVVIETVRKDMEDFWDISLEGIPVFVNEVDEFSNEGTPKRLVTFFSEEQSLLYDATIEIGTQTLIELDSLDHRAKTVADAFKSEDYIAAAAAIARDKLSLSPDSTKAVCYLPTGRDKEILDYYFVRVVFPDDLFYVEVSIDDLSPLCYRFFSDANELEAHLARDSVVL
ncbi:MAG: M56 family metallopeptidase [Oscillospiraceae bacterium]|jgi:beta-lactamase regulating signal transducer with metallopeptidase domain|nr:M56 family metallopeptidase [Oscillospiraceae bacterium]